MDTRRVEEVLGGCGLAQRCQDTVQYCGGQTNHSEVLVRNLPLPDIPIQLNHLALLRILSYVYLINSLVVNLCSTCAYLVRLRNGRVRGQLFTDLLFIENKSRNTASFRGVRINYRGFDVLVPHSRAR